jgi:hypothetical protein
MVEKPVPYISHCVLLSHEDVAKLRDWLSDEPRGALRLGRAVFETTAQDSVFVTTVPDMTYDKPVKRKPREKQ